MSGESAKDILEASVEAAACEQLRVLVPEWRRQRLVAALTEKSIMELSRVLAKARGVAFLRMEQIETEFSKGAE